MSISRNIPVSSAAQRSPAASDTANLAHELSNLLDGSLRNLSLALSRLATPADEAGDETAVRLRASVESMKQMAAILKRFMSAGPEQDPAMLHWSESTLAEAVRYAVRSIEPLAAANRIAIDVRLGDLASVHAGAMFPVIANAVRNAAEAIGRDGRIQIIGEYDGETARIDVLDDGPGLAADLPRTSDGFVVTGRTTKPDGHGIGLSISKQIIDALDGTITLTERPEGGAALSVRWRPPQED